MTCRGQSSGVAATLRLGEAVGRHARPGLTVALQGDLGSGKTVLTKGIARGLEVPGWRYVSSPTFTIHNQYRGRLELHHLDLYRLVDAGELEDLGFEEVLGGSGVCVLEWPDAFFEELPADLLVIRFHWTATHQRSLEFAARGALSAAVLQHVAAAAGLHEGSHTP